MTKVALARYSTGTKTECRIFPSTCWDRWPFPVVSSTRSLTLTVAGGYFHARVEIDNVLAAWRRVPVDVVLGLGFAKK